jgi:dipeptidyl aminopeptidase/acylaminoacyl peptidase
MVFASAQSAPPFGGATGIASGSLQLLPNAGGSWGPASVLVPFANGANNYYPTYSPDGAWVLFNRSPSNTNSYDAAKTDAEVWVVAATGGTPIRLSNASTGGDSWPKWTPDVQPYKSGTLIWLTFSSYRPYGLRLAKDEQAQLWMTAFDPERAKNGQDPSYPAFWLPFQSMKSGNHIAQWVTKVERKLCQSDADCDAGEKCFGTCRPPTN